LTRKLNGVLCVFRAPLSDYREWKRRALTNASRFNKNVLDIIDFKYGYNSAQDTEIEEHSYKDYTVTSDYFTDFFI
jgi:hypothetical protein